MPIARAHPPTRHNRLLFSRRWGLGAILVALIAALVMPAAAAAVTTARQSHTSHTSHTSNTSHTGKPRISADSSSGMDLDDAWTLTKGDPSVLIAYIEGGINWHLGDAASLDPNIYVNWHELPVPCTGTTLVGATMVVSGVTEPCSTYYSNNEADYEVNGGGVVNALDWSNDPRVKDSNGNGIIDPEDLIAAFSGSGYEADADGGPYPYDISGWDFYDNDNDPATTDSAYAHANDQMDTIQHECPQCMILPIKAGEEALDSTDKLAEAWLFAAEQGARVIVSVTADLGYSTFMAQTISYLESKGIIMVEATNDFDSPDHQGGMFWPYVIPGNGAVADAAGTAWTRSDLTSWGTKSMFTVATSGGSTSESTPTTGGIFGLLLSYGDLAYSQGLLKTPLTGPEAIQVMRETATAITDPTLPWPGSPGEWNPQYGYGMPQVYDAMKAVEAEDIPPAPEITSPAWYTPIDPTTTSSVPVTGTVQTANGAAFTWQVQYGLGGNPSSWTTFGTGSATGSFSGTFGTLSLSQIPKSFWSAAFSLSSTKEVETMDQYTVTFRVVVTDSNELVGEDRLAVSVFHDSTALPGFPMSIGSSGESQPALVDLQGTGKLDIVFATSDGDINALDPTTGQELPGWPAHTDPLSVLGSYPGVNPGDQPVIAPVAVGDLFHTGQLDVVVTSEDGYVYVFNADGQLLPGWPQELDTGVTPPPIPKPADPLTRFPVAGATANPVLVHLTGSSQLQIVQAGMDGYLHAYNPDGTEVSGWPVKVALPSSFSVSSGYELLDDQTLPTAPAVAYLQSPNVPDIVERSQYTEITGTGITLGAKAIVFAYQPNGQLVPGWPATLPGLAEYYGSAMGPITEGTDAPVAGPVTAPAGSQGALDQVIVNPVFTPASLLGGNGQTLATYDPSGGSALPFTSTGALGMFGGQLTFAQSGVDVTSLIGAELSPNTGDPIAKEEVAFPADGGGSSYTPNFPTSMQGLDFLGGPDIADVTGNGENSIVEGGDSSAIQAYEPDGSQAPGFPKFTSGWVIAAPSIGDLFSNGTNDVVATTREGYLFAWSTSGSASSTGEWTNWRHDTWNTANYSTDSASPGVARNVNWSPGDTALSFEAPGDNWYDGTVSHYDITLAPSGQVLTVAPSGPAGTTQTVAIPAGTTGLSIQAVNAADNLSGVVTEGATPPAPTTAFGYLAATASGQVDAAGTATSYGSPAASGLNLQKPIVGMAETPDGGGYWLVASDGGIFSYGDANFYGSTGAIKLNQPIVGMAPTPDGMGYWLVASDGGIFTFGDAQFYGSTGAIKLNQPIVGMAATADGKGYWLVASDGGIFTFGDAQFYGSAVGEAGGTGNTQQIAGMAMTPDGGGYWLVSTAGDVDAFGDAVFFGSSAQTGALPGPAAAIVPTPDGGGYWVITIGGNVYTYGDATNGGAVSVPAGDKVVGASP